MPNSPINPSSNPQNDETSNTQKRICDFCGESIALVYCRADNAKLCLSCDRQVHSTNQLFTKHTRFQLCDSCDLLPATIYCCTEHSVLCQNCDFEVHKSSNNHDRRPLEGFSGRPSVIEFAGFVGFEEFDCKKLLIDDEKSFCENLLGGFEDDNNGNDEFCDFFGWDTPAIFHIDELICSTDKIHNFHAMNVPPLPKDRNLSCGLHKQEIIRQLCELAKLEPVLDQDFNTSVKNHFEVDGNQEDFRVQHQEQAFQHDGGHPIFKGNEARQCTRGNDGSDTANDFFLSPWLSEINFDESGLNSDTKSGICSSADPGTTECNSQIPVGTESTSIPHKVSSHEFTAADRVSAVSRYKEKKRTRRFEKHIRYESRKLQAENRIRVKGRFAKMDNKAI